MSGKGKPFKKGHAGGPGRPKMPPEIRAAANLTMAEARAKLSGYLKLSLDELSVIVKDRSKPAMDIWIATIVFMGIKHGDQQRLNFMFDRLIGKVTEKVELSHVEPTIIEFTDGRKVVMGMEDTTKKES